MLVILIVATYYLVIQENGSTIPVDETDFSVTNVEDIQKIFLADKSGRETILEKREAGWFVNGKYPALKSSMRGLLKTIKKVRVMGPVPEAEHNKIVKDLSVKATKVEIYDKSGSLIKAYYIGGPTQDHFGTYMILEIDGKLATKPYITHILGFEGFLSVYYFLDEKLWRDRTIFSYQHNEISSIVVSYPANPENSFTITAINEDSVTIDKLTQGEGGIGNGGSYDQEKIKQYLTLYSNVHAEAYQYDNPIEDSIRNSTPYCLIDVTSYDETVNSIKIYHLPLNKRSKKKYDEKGDYLPYDLDRYFALIHFDKDFVVIQNYVFSKILRRYDDFMTTTAL